MRALHQALFLSALGAAALAAPAHAEKQISPYIEVGQVLDADLKNGGDVLTYSYVSAGIDATIRNSRTEVQINYNYQRRFDYEGDVSADDIHTGIAVINHQLIPNLLTLEAGGLAARARTDIRGAADNALGANSNNISQVYSAFAGPTLATQIGGLDVGAAYRFGYTKVEDSQTIFLPPGQERLDLYDDSTAHMATASIGMRPDILPFGWQVSGGWEQERAGQLKQRFESKFVRGDVTVPLTPTLAVVGGVGYEDMEISQKDALRDVNGDPVVDNNGRFVTDPASPRQIAYDQDGLIYDAGVMWRPSPRTQLEARAGYRYGSTTYFGSFSHQLSPAASMSVLVYDGVESFGRLLEDNISRLPTSFNVADRRFGGAFNGCVFGRNGGAGGCMDDAFQSINTANFRNRGVTAMISAQRGQTALGLGLGYAQRRYFAPRFGNAFTVDGVKDKSWFAQAYYAYDINENSGVNLDAYLDYYQSGLAGAGDVIGTGLSGTYWHNFNRHLSASATGQVYSSDQEGADSSLIGSLLVGMRLQY